MNIIVFAYLVSTLICFESAITVYRLNPLSRLNRIYTALSGSFSFYSIVMIQFLLSPDERATWFWHRIFVLLACIFTAIGVHYFLELTGKKIARSRIFPAGLYTLALIVAIPAITFFPIIEGTFRIPWGWAIVIKNTGWAVLLFSYLMGSILACALLAFRWRFTAGTLREKKQANVIIVSGLIGAAGLAHLFIPGIHSDIISAVFIHFYYTFCFIVFVSGIRYAIKKYGLMTMTPGNPASGLFEGMREALFLINTRGEIIFMNENGRMLAGHSVKDKNGRSIFSLFTTDDILRHEFNELLSGRESSRPVILTARTGPRGIALEASLLGIKNEAGSLIGLMVIVREGGGIPGLQDEYSLSPRETEVLLLVCSGLSAQDIALECDIALQTAKSHIHNIYIKTGLKNRVELSNLLNKHI